MVLEMRLHILILFLLCTSAVAQYGSTDTLLNFINVIRAVGGSTTALFFGEYRHEQYPKKVCPGYYEELTKVETFALTGMIVWNDIMTLMTTVAYKFNKCDEVLDEPDLVINSFWGRLGTFVRALADLPFEA